MFVLRFGFSGQPVFLLLRFVFFFFQQVCFSHQCLHSVTERDGSTGCITAIQVHGNKTNWRGREYILIARCRMMTIANVFGCSGGLLFVADTQTSHHALLFFTHTTGKGEMDGREENTKRNKRGRQKPTETGAAPR